MAQLTLLCYKCFIFFTDVIIEDINKNAASPAAAIKGKAHHFSCFCFLTSKVNIPSFAICNDTKKNLYIVEKIKNISYLQSMLEYRNVSCAISNI